MNRKSFAFLAAIGIVCFVLCVSWLNAETVVAGPAGQVRPTLTPTPLPPKHPPRLHGGILDWGEGYMPAGVQVVLEGDGWEIPVETDDNGHYLYQDIGNEVAFLNAIVPDNRGELRPYTQDLPVNVKVGAELIVNMAFYPDGKELDPIVTIDMISSAQEAKQDDNVSFIITVNNKWDDWVNQVIVADYLPEGLSYVNATVSQGTVSWDRGLVWAELGPVAADTSATVTIMTKVDTEAALGNTITNQAAVYYRENVASQAKSEIKIVETTNHVLPVTGIASVLPVAGVLLAGVLLGIRRLRRVG
jgi:uncharacterized repeat protein (TIGR01451 family)